MKSFFTKLRKLIFNGLIFLMPVIVLIIVLSKAWGAATEIGGKIAGLFGMKTIMGLGSVTVFTSLLLILVCLLCGFLVRFSFMRMVNKSLERTMLKYVPGYANYKAMAEEKLENKQKEVSYKSTLIMYAGYWQPAFVVEQDDMGHCVVFLPGIPDTTSGHLLLAQQDQLKMIGSLTSKQLQEVLKKMGKGLLTEHHIGWVGTASESRVLSK
jgi:uncharacterized membrane protein